MRHYYSAPLSNVESSARYVYKSHADSSRASKVVTFLCLFVFKYTRLKSSKRNGSKGILCLYGVLERHIMS